jgi:RNA polymerase sigma-54 factor
MALEQKLQMKLSQRLIMTPSLQQAIKLLQMSKLDLLEEINQELVDNPALEEGNLEGDREETPAEAEPAEEERNSMEEIDFEAFFQDLEASYIPPSAPPEDVQLPSFEQTVSKTQDLYDYLYWQLNLAASLHINRDIGRAIIGNLDEDGYLAATPGEIAAIGNWPPTEVERCLEIVRGFDPPGVGAVDLEGCLLLQLDRLGLLDTPVERIIRHHLELVQSRRYEEIAAALECPLDEVYASVQILKRLDPKPGQKFNPEQSRYVIPDVHVVKVGEEYRIVLNDDGMPRLRVSPAYRRMLANLNDKSPEAREYLREKCRSALRLIKSVEERQRTIMKVATSIVKHQRGFLDRGVQALRPLILKDVADDIGMHESTVSRVVNNKYMHTPRGLFEMRYFFHSGIHTDRGSDVSSVAVKEKIKGIIEAEDPRSPRSDSAIVSLLRTQGIKIARRTVAKYREEARILSSTERKKAAVGP